MAVSGHLHHHPLQYLEHHLCPLLDEMMVVILNHAAFHKSQRSRELIIDYSHALKGDSAAYNGLLAVAS